MQHNFVKFLPLILIGLMGEMEDQASLRDFVAYPRCPRDKSLTPQRAKAARWGPRRSHPKRAKAARWGPRRRATIMRPSGPVARLSFAA